nr:U-Kazal-Dg21.2 [Helicoverpa armigera]
MNYLLLILVVLNLIFRAVNCNECKDDCPKEGKMTCGLSPENKNYTLFPSECALKAYSICHNVKFVETPLKFCINHEVKNARRVYGESCPLFCPNHYRPVCGMSKMRAYIYKTFNNGCYFDMLSCRGDDLEGYVEVPLEFCQRHLMKNIFKEQVVVSGINDYRDYHEYN